VKKAAKIPSENDIPVMDCICLSAVLIVWVHQQVIKLTLSSTKAILVSDYISSKLLELLKERFFSILYLRRPFLPLQKLLVFAGRNKTRNNTVVRQHM